MIRATDCLNRPNGRKRIPTLAAVCLGAILSLGLLVAVHPNRVGGVEPLRLSEQYGSIPAGVILEGKLDGFDALKTVTYDAKSNVFTLNKELSYPSPLTQAEMVELMKALLEDDRIGVSINDRSQTIVYGALDKRSELVADLVAADTFLAGIVFGRPKLYAGTKLPGDYKPKPVGKQENPVASSVLFYQYVLLADKAKKTAAIADFGFELLLVPLKQEKARDGGHLPDMESYEKKNYGKDFEENVAHLKKHKDDYLKLKRVARAAKIGEAAAFIRQMKNDGINLKELSEKMAPKRRRGIFR